LDEKRRLGIWGVLQVPQLTKESGKALQVFPAGQGCKRIIVNLYLR